MQTFINDLYARLPSIVGALAILIIGLIIAYIARAAINALLRRTGLGDRVARLAGAQDMDQARQAERLVGTVVFWVILLLTLVAFFNALNLPLISQPLNQFLGTVFAYLPGIIGAALLAVIAYVLARILRALVVRASQEAGLDSRLNARTGPETVEIPVSRSLGEIAFYLVLLLFLPAILNALGLQGLLEPVNALLNRFLGFLPQIFAAAVILFVGYFVAKIVRRIVTGLLAAVGADQFAARIGIDRVLGNQRLSNVLGLIAYVLIFIPSIVAALNALQLEAITAPASAMLNRILLAIPNIFAAIALLAIAYVVGRIVAGLLTNLLTGLDFDSVPQRLGMMARNPNEVPTPPSATQADVAARTHTPQSSSAAADAATGPTTPSRIVGWLVLGAVMLSATIEALNLLGFAELANVVLELTVLFGRVLLGLLVFAIGLWLANLSYRALQSGGNPLLAHAARVAILVLAGAMGLRQMGIAEDIINLAFGLTLGALAVAVAIAFGFGGRDIAQEILARYRPAIQRNLPEPEGGGPGSTLPSGRRRRQQGDQG